MNDFEVHDVTRLLNQSGELMDTSSALTKIKDEINSIMREINSAWESDAIDKVSFMTSLLKNVENMDILCRAVTQLSNNLNEFSSNTIKAASQN